MQVTHGTAEEIENAKVVLVLGVIAIAAFWRTLLRIALAIIAALMLVVLGFGALMIFQAMHA
jgi:hypothetical protein